MRDHYKVLVTIVLFFSVAIRLLLYWVNPPGNSFDNHFEPIFMIMNTGCTPAKDACFQCYHPPVFYWISALVGDSAKNFGLTLNGLTKLLQFLPCLYGVLSLWVWYLIAEKLPLSGFARFFAFAAACILPRHVYMSAMNSNDTLSYLLVSVCVYLLLVIVEERLSVRKLAALSVAITLAVFTKYTAFAILPTACAVFAAAFSRRLIQRSKRNCLLVCIAFLLPLTMLTSYMVHNTRRYGTALPWNVTLYDPSVDRPRDPGGISFVTFKPWEEIEAPILAPGRLNSFWTMLYGGMWFDTEPYFVSYLDTDSGWWDRYYDWYRGKGAFPGENHGQSRITRWCGSSLETLGLVPLALVMIGLCRYFRGKKAFLAESAARTEVVLTLLPLLFLCNAAGIVALTLKLPVYNSIKASYLLNSVPFFMVFMGFGAGWAEKSRIGTVTVPVCIGLLFLFSLVHFTHFIYMMI
jgi:hypothetical protein